MRSLFSIASVLFVGLIGCRAGGDSPPAAAGVDKIVDNASKNANHAELADSTGNGAPTQICPDICGLGTLCEMPDGSCMEVCNPCYCTRDGGTVVDKCPETDSAQRAFGAQTVATGDRGR